MAKRFVDTEMNRVGMRGVDVKLRFAFEWLWQNCDHAGVWRMDADLFRFECGYKLNVEDLLKSCQRVKRLPNGALFLVDFVPVNYGKLKPGYNPHKPVFRSLELNGINPSTLEFQDLGKTSPSLEDKGEGEDVLKEEGMERASAKQPDPLPFPSPAFAEAVARWERHRSEIKHRMTPETRKAWLKKCQELGEARSIAAIDHSIANGWQGMFEAKASASPTPAPHQTAQRRDLITDWDYKLKQP